ncbi:hypothetical protein I4Q36_05920 [Tuanshanicoccus lijuaniae]|uniref:hypothetical protein n=1 Tax=Aerococcaceae bacterium zg-1292 TaxID=2774330 RepID=UPI0019382D65|nr:hypothetical protein [Aerococcaceae bacterium zg-1292]QQA36361.1 hypothetical protein I4Q36_05920 [Aerococcaceae bacterium zg-1292]
MKKKNKKAVLKLISDKGNKEKRQALERNFELLFPGAKKGCDLEELLELVSVENTSISYAQLNYIITTYPHFQNLTFEKLEEIRITDEELHFLIFNVLNMYTYTAIQVGEYKEAVTYYRIIIYNYLIMDYIDSIESNQIYDYYTICLLHLNDKQKLKQLADLLTNFDQTLLYRLSIMYLDLKNHQYEALNRDIKLLVDSEVEYFKLFAVPMELLYYLEAGPAEMEESIEKGLLPESIVELFYCMVLFVEYNIALSRLLDYIQYYLEQTEPERVAEFIDFEEDEYEFFEDDWAEIHGFNNEENPAGYFNNLSEDLQYVQLLSKPEFQNIRIDILRVFWKRDLRSKHDFLEITEKELLAIKGVGRVTVQTLKENGVRFKK